MGGGSSGIRAPAPTPEQHRRGEEGSGMFVSPQDLTGLEGARGEQSDFNVEVVSL